jgi:hypothetical protein
MSFILYPQVNKQLAVVTPTGILSIEEVIVQTVPPDTSYKVVDTLNVDHYFFDAYEYDEELGAVVNFEKAKEIQRNRWRAARTPLLQQLDIEFQRAQESGETAALQRVVAKKIALRGVTDTPLPDDLEGIKNTWPDVLNS